jgi:hypothetical protein
MEKSLGLKAMALTVEWDDAASEMETFRQHEIESEFEI